MAFSNISGAWRTRKQALSHILSELIGGRLGAVLPKSQPWNETCAYEAVRDGKVTHCGVGCLFTPAQIRSISARGLNGKTVDALEYDIGTKNLETVTGLPMDELCKIQVIHDGEWSKIQNEPKTSKLFSYLNNALKSA